MEEYVNYLDENGMITIKWWIADESISPGSGIGSGGLGSGSDYDDDDEHTLS
jgi:hypothetical protein